MLTFLLIFLNGERFKILEKQDSGMVRLGLLSVKTRFEIYKIK